MKRALLEVVGLTKSYPGVTALQNVTMDIEHKEIHALMGENGAGKSTLVKVITGVTECDAGEILFNGESITKFSPAQIRDLGISVIFQDINLVPDLNVAENIYLAQLPSRDGILIDKRSLHQKTKKILHDLDLDFSEKIKVSELSALNRKMVAIARSLSFQPKLIIMDEPTSALSRHEIKILFKKIRFLKKKGVSILYISHFLEEVFEIADRITVIRDGQKIGTKAISQVTPHEIVYMMVGHKVSFQTRKDYSRVRTNDVMKVEHVSLSPFINDVSFNLAKGEILGITGSAGSGKSAIARVLFGINKPEIGFIRLNGNQVTYRLPSDAISKNFGYVPQDRHSEGLLLGDTILKNISLPSLNKLSKFGFINKKKERRLSQKYYDRLAIKARSLNMQVQYLSGGNQQKVSIAKWLALNPEILVFDEPTQGIDVGTKQEIYKLIKELADQGISIIYISSEPTELVQLCDRVLVLRRGKIVNSLVGNNITREQIIKEITGAKDTNNNNEKREK